MIGTIVNAGAIIAGALLGNLLRGGFSEKYRSVIMQGISLVVILLGFSMALKSENILVLILSIVSGGILGELLRIEERLSALGERLESRFGGGGGNRSGLFTRGLSLPAWFSAWVRWPSWGPWKAGSRESIQPSLSNL